MRTKYASLEGSWGTINAEIYGSRIISNPHSGPGVV